MKKDNIDFGSKKGKNMPLSKEEIRSAAEARLQKEKEELEKAIENTVKRNENSRKELIKQREAFAKDESYFEKYKDLKIDGRNILVRLFVFREENISEGLLMMPKAKGSIQGGQYDWEKTSYNERVLPIGKVIKVGREVENTNLKEGCLVLLPTAEIEGMEKNPEFMHLLQNTQGNLDPLFDQFKIPQEVPAVQVHWRRHIFKHWDNLEPDDDDRMTFLVPETKAMAVWDS